jgi:hypothetical protein
MTKKKVMVNILNTGTTAAGWETQIYAWMQEKTKNYEFKVFLPTGRPIPDNRHKIVKNFLEGDWDYLVMLDDDNPCYKNIFDLLDLNLPVVGGVYPGKSKSGILFFAFDAVTKNGGVEFRPISPERRNGLQKVDAVATGLIVIQRWVLQKMYDEGIIRPFEEGFDDYGRLNYGDDMGFCLKCKNLGIDVYAHFDYIGSHFKVVDLLWVADLVAYAAETGRTNFPDEKTKRA